MRNILRRRLSLNVFASFVLIIVIPSVLAILIGYQLLSKSVEHEVNIHLTNSITGYHQQVKFLEENCVRMARHLAADTGVAAMLREGAHTELEERLRRIYELGGMDILEVEDRKGRVVVRAHHPRQTGDVKIHQRIVQTGLAGRAAVGYEQGRSGVAIRAVAPVRGGDTVIGLVMVGNSFSEDFVNHIKLLIGMENGIYKDTVLIASTYTGLDSLDNATFDLLKAGLDVTIDDVLLNGADPAAPCAVILRPLMLDDGTCWGAIALGMPKKAEQQYLRGSRNVLVFTIAFGIGIALLIYFPLARHINRSLREIVVGISGVRMGQFDARIRIDAEDEFRIIADSFNEMMEKIELYDSRVRKLQDELIRSEKLAMAGRFAAGLAHEMRNPMSSIKMMVQIIRDRRLKPDAHTEVNVILREIDRLNHLLKDLLEYAKPAPLRFTRHDLRAVIRSCLELFAVNMERLNIRVETMFDSSLPHIKMDGEKVRIVFVNLILNAIQAMPDGGELCVKTQRTPDGRVRIMISDTGAGIGETDLPNIFEPFFTTKTEGTGLGLTLARSIVERHGGAIAARRSDGRTVFDVVLPVVGDGDMDVSRPRPRTAGMPFTQVGDGLPEV